MLLPNDFQSTIAKTFYDKDITILGVDKVIEADGAISDTTTNVKGSFKGNPRLVNFKKIQKDYGLDYQIDIAVTCSPTEVVDQQDLIEYAGVKYDVTDVLPFDSHKLIVGTKWQSQ